MESNLNIRWKSPGLCLLDNSIVGSVDAFASGGTWEAWGCFDEWQDTPLGQYKSQDEAKQAVEDWVRDHPYTKERL